MSTYAYNLTSIPRETRQHIFSYLPPKDLLVLPMVCKLFNKDLSNEFFQKQCKEHFYFLNSIPLFCDPLNKTVENSWQLICFCLSEKKTTQNLYKVAEKVVKSSIEQFKSYLLDCINSCQSRQNESQIRKELICGKYYQDPHSKIDQAWKFFQKNWTPTDEKELEELEKVMPSHAHLQNQQEDPAFIYWGNYAYELLQMGQKTSSLSREELLGSVIRLLKEKKADVEVIKFLELLLKLIQAKNSYDCLEKERKQLEEIIEKMTLRITFYNNIIRNPDDLKKYATEIVYRTLCLLSRLKKWTKHLPTIYELRDEVLWTDPTSLSQHKINHIKEQINSLPQEVSTSIWHALYTKCANQANEWQWSENHFHEHFSHFVPILEQLLFCDLEDLLDYDDFNENPVQNLQFLKAFAESRKNINPHLP